MVHRFHSSWRKFYGIVFHANISLYRLLWTSALMCIAQHYLDIRRNIVRSRPALSSNGMLLSGFLLTLGNALPGRSLQGERII